MDDTATAVSELFTEGYDDWSIDEEAITIGKLLAMFSAIDPKNTGAAKTRAFVKLMDKSGIPPSWTRKARKILDPASTKTIQFERFHDMFESLEHADVFEKALLGHLVIPDFEEFCTQLSSMCDSLVEERSGEVAQYIPQLASVDPDLFAVSVHTVDGQVFNWGSHETLFSMQSCAKPITYCMVEHEVGDEEISKFIGHEPSGKHFDVQLLATAIGFIFFVFAMSMDFCLNKHNRPHNPLINTGAILVCSLFRPELEASNRFDATSKFFSKLAPGSHVQFDNATYLSELNTADRNFALGHYVKDAGAFPPHIDSKRKLDGVLQFYFQTCAIQVNTAITASIYAVLANGGVVPATNVPMISPDTTRNIMSLMLSCGTYTYSGEFAYFVGQPAKSSVSGCVAMVVPNKFSLVIYSPRLDTHGNSVRGIALCRLVAQQWNIHSLSAEQDVLFQTKQAKSVAFSSCRVLEYGLLHAASCGDSASLRTFIGSGVSVACTDVDGMNALHYACSNGRMAIVELLLAAGANVNAKSKTGKTPLGLALAGRHEMIAEMLKQAGATPVTHGEAMGRILSRRGMRRNTVSMAALPSATATEPTETSDTEASTDSTRTTPRGRGDKKKQQTLENAAAPESVDNRKPKKAAKAKKTSKEPAKVKRASKEQAAPRRAREVANNFDLMVAEFGEAKAKKLRDLPLQLRAQAILQLRTKR